MDSKPIDIEAIFNAARKKRTAAERVAYLDGVCRDDPELRARVEALLKAHEEAGGFLESPPGGIGGTLDSPPLTEGPGTRIGRYKLLQLIGEGGFGVVYMAEQEKPIRRRVALKIIKLGMDTKQVIARFEAERQALALMDHANIARVFDAGATDTGRPYFVMELVKGIPITEYCDKNNLDTRQRLDLFIDVCKAVQHAHQKGIIHRDIKPSNVMITLHDGKPVPKIIDFGIAKATQHRLTEKTLFTEYRQLIGTPEYMSPEQAEMSGLDVDTRSDIYSLGVLLYELLTGTTPFEAEKLRSAAYDEIRRIIREDEPPRPSTRLSSLGDALTDVAKHRHVQPEQLCKIVRGDLDWVVMKALEKDRTRRYETANEFAGDIERHLGDEPVVAGPPSVRYRLSKFVRRNRAPVTAAAAVAAAIIVGLVVSTVLYFQADQARKREITARTQAEQARISEAQQRQIAEQEANRAEEESEGRRRALYVNRIGFADASYRDGNTRRLRELLELCPADLRGWEWHRLNHILDQAQMTLQGHDSSVYSAAFSPNGKRIASASRDKTIKVWDVETGAEVMTLRGHKNVVRAVSFSPDGKRLVSGSDDKLVKMWDATSGDKLMSLSGHDRIFSVAFSPDGKIIISGSEDGTIKVWDASTGAELLSLQEESAIASVKFSPDSAHIIAAGANNMIKVFDATTGNKLMTLQGHKEPVFSVTFSPDGKQIASGSYDYKIKLWDAQSGNEVLTLTGHRGEVRSVAFSPDGTRIVSGSDDNTIKVWDAANGTELMTLHGHESTVFSVAFSPDGKRIVSSGGWDKTIKLWDAATSPEEITLRGHKDWVSSVAFSPDGKRIVSASHDRTIKMWDVATGAEIMTLRGHKHNVRSLAFRPDGKQLVSGSTDGTFKIWDVDTGKEVLSKQAHDLLKPKQYGEINSICFSPDGKNIVVGGGKGIVKVYEAASGKELTTLSGPENYVGCVAFSPDGKQIVSSSWDGTIKVWDALTGAEVMTFRGDRYGVFSIAFSPDGKRIVSGGEDPDAPVKVWDAATGAEVMALRGHKNISWSVAFSPDGKRIVSCCGDVKLWDAATGAEIMTIRGYDVMSVAFSPDSKTLAVGHGDSITLLESTAPAGGYGPRRVAEAARKVVDKLYEKHDLYQKVIDELKADEVLDEAVRKVALQIANARLWEDAEKLKKQSLESAGPEEGAAQ